MALEKIIKYLPQKERKNDYGRSEYNSIDRNGHIYHTIQQGWNKDNIYNCDDAGIYRHNLLRRLCSTHGVTIIFSVVMPNHTHDVLMAEKWDDIAEVYRILNSRVSHYLRKKNPKKYLPGRNIFDERPVYKVVKDIIQLFYLGKYIYDNPLPYITEKRYIPFNCFSTMEKGYLLSSYNEKVYIDLFGMDFTEMCTIYRTKTKQEVLAYAQARFSSWTQTDNDEVFKVDATKPWLYDENIPNKN